MAPLFGNKEAKAERDAVAQAEANRLLTLSVSDLAAELMPAFGTEGPGRGSPPEVNLLQLGMFLMRSAPEAKYIRELERPLREAVQALEGAGLIVRLGQANSGQRLAATRLGEEALADGSVRQRLPT